MPLPEPKPLPPLDDLTLEHLGVVASEIQRNQATKEGVMLFTLCAPALVDELRRFRAFRLRMQDMASRMAERSAAEGPALRLLDGGRSDA
ncbi:hypothetical protein SAMN05444336_101279 [Albimonas donghaensis]|uniref:Uncharacterized protein n=1 Tax=Albimonas donghaensis TaxID=356660 RepID=A0A1H2R9I7_9RHOB|nr:hypothetical protein [Albimonas donghaensis]SDW16067.1 hypothetical protein SAMN05444336_101279 [Albimonas donghaensis]